MDDELTPEQQFEAESAETMVPRLLMAGYSPEDVVDELSRHGWERDRAWELVDRSARDLRRFRKSPTARGNLIASARRQFFMGLGFLGLGIGVTLFSLYAAAIGFIGYWIACYGAILVGVGLTAVGWRRWRFYAKAARTTPLEESRNDPIRPEPTHRLDD